MLPTNLTYLTAAELRTALIMASKKEAPAYEKDYVLREYRRRGISPNIRKRK